MTNSLLKSVSYTITRTALTALIAMTICTPVIIWAQEFGQDQPDKTGDDSSTGDNPMSFGEGLEKAKGTAESAGLASGVNIEGVIFSVISWLFAIAAAVALAVLVWGAFMYIVSLGEESRTRKAKSIILWAIIGLIVMGLSFTILYTVMDFLFFPADLPPSG